MTSWLRKWWKGGDWQTQCQADWTALAPGDPDAIMAAELRDRFHAKQCRSIVRWTLSDNSRRLVVYLKRHYRDTWWNTLKTFFAGSRHSAAWQEWKHLTWAAEHDFPVPRAVAVGEKLGPGGRLQSFLAIEELTGMTPLHKAIPQAATLLPPSTFAAWKRGLVAELARLTRRLHDLRHFHKDLYLCHFYVSDNLIHRPPDEWTNRVHMIDLHRLQQHRFSWRWWQLKDLGQLLYSSNVEGVTARDRQRFWRLYFPPLSKGGLGGVWRRCLRWGVLLRWRRYSDHNSSRRAAA